MGGDRGGQQRREGSVEDRFDDEGAWGESWGVASAIGGHLSLIDRRRGVRTYHSRLRWVVAEEELRSVPRQFGASQRDRSLVDGMWPHR